MAEYIVSLPASLAQLVSVLAFINTTLRILLCNVWLMNGKILIKHFRFQCLIFELDGDMCVAKCLKTTLLVLLRKVVQRFALYLRFISNFFVYLIFGIQINHKVFWCFLMDLDMLMRVCTVFGEFQLVRDTDVLLLLDITIAFEKFRLSIVLFKGAITDILRANVKLIIIFLSNIGKPAQIQAALLLNIGFIQFLLCLYLIPILLRLEQHSSLP